MFVEADSTTAPSVGSFARWVVLRCNAGVINHILRDRNIRQKYCCGLVMKEAVIV